MQDALLVIIALAVIQIHVPKFEIFEVNINREELVYFFSIMSNPVL